MFLLVFGHRIYALQRDTSMASPRVWVKHFSEYLAHEISHSPYFLSEAFCILIFLYFLIDSGLFVLNGFDFHFWWRDSENREYSVCTEVEYLPDQKCTFFQGFSFQFTYTLYSLSVFLLARSLQVILEICATYRLVSHLLADWWLICRLRAMHDFQEQCQTVFRAVVCLSSFFLGCLWQA